ncbi:DUF1189 family protein [Clostridium sp.]|uniref:DUF1189 family protein n=1 Tax=Clostridium sp. TaxID=1506 RepID=UPI00284BE7AF|nr:DUF1189 family protein [Clostridium sp.]MDR3594887.1 DUF1189 family protein [Clostridium sp.]
MNYNTNFLTKFITSIYDIKVFSKYAKEGIFRSISYAMLLTLILVGTKDLFTIYTNGHFEFKSFISVIIINFGTKFLNLLFNCLIVTIVASIFTIFIKMIVKYIALFSLTLYAATLPLIIQAILEGFNPNIDFDTMFIIGTLTYVLLILKYIKDEIIRKMS